MAEKKETVKKEVAKKETVKKDVIKYSKSAIMNSKKFAKDRFLLSSELYDNRLYTIEEIEKIIKEGKKSGGGK